ncbi:somatostatin-1A [Melanotaenia boesemani]|uniref:somatostatin-1A n=1 Tax=Melanotaenia boesemani TaxID=1250792 RepID=UPI001C040F3C|nr:somatostatin-1A [Melanotaenia boesemani]
MLRFQVQVLLMFLCSSVLLVQISGAPRNDQLTEALRADLASDKNLIRLLLLRFVSELMASREEMLQELEDDDLGGRARLTRRHIRFSQRERKAGCRNFFWKTFTSC